jgi:phytoene dehydrogenase-like protein
MADAIIIGAGYAGISAAALLAYAGRKVIVLEAAGTIGGRARSYTDTEGYVWEYGAHSHRLSHKGIANAVFRRLGDISFSSAMKVADKILLDEWNRDR